jgi:hypothetical protein
MAIEHLFQAKHVSLDLTGAVTMVFHWPSERQRIAVSENSRYSTNTHRDTAAFDRMSDLNTVGDGTKPSKFFYGWYIVGVGILVNIAGTFAFSSTLSIFSNRSPKSWEFRAGVFANPHF